MNIPRHFHIFEAMDCFYFIVMRGSAKCSFPLANESLLVVSSEYWLMLVEQSELMNFGRLLRFYSYMYHSHTSLCTLSDEMSLSLMDGQTDNKRHVDRPCSSFQLKPWVA